MTRPDICAIDTTPAVAVAAAGTRRRLSRRAVLALPLVVGLSGCRLRLEDGEHLPFVPREPVADETILVAAVARLRELSRAARDAGLAPIAVAHARQADVVSGLLGAQGVPAAAISPSPSAYASTSGSTAPTTPSATQAPDAPSRPTAAQVYAAEGRAVAAAELTRLGALTTTAAPQLRSIAAYQAVTAIRNGAKLTWPAPPTSGTAVDAALLAAYRAAAYALELAAARSGTADETAKAPDPKATQRARLLVEAQWVQARARALLTRLPNAAAPPLGYALPFPVSTPADARRLAVVTFARLELAVGDTLATATGPATAVAIEALASVLARGAAWGLALRPFPGLAEPKPASAPSGTPAATSTPTGGTSTATPAGTSTTP